MFRSYPPNAVNEKCNEDECT
jgi:HK97 gp10 family phage protein